MCLEIFKIQYFFLLIILQLPNQSIYNKFLHLGFVGLFITTNTSGQPNLFYST